MSENLSAEIEIPSPEPEPRDFRQAISEAIANAPLVELTPSLESSETHLKEQVDATAHVKEWSDDAELAVHYEERANCVSTYSVKQYPALLKQVWEALPGSYTEEERAAMIAEDLEHEMQHGAALREVAPLVLGHYGVMFSRTVLPGEQEPSVTWMPFFASEGTMRKIDYATVIAGPDKLAENDVHFLNSLGYGSAAEVAERRAALEAAEAAKHAEIGELALQSPDQP